MGDITGTGEIEIDDALEILKFVVKLPSKLVEFLRREQPISVGELIFEDTKLFARWTAIPLNVPTGLAAVSGAAGTVVLTWNTVDSADGYEVFRSDTRLTGYSRIATVDSGNAETFTNQGLTAGARWFYLLRAYQEIDGVRTFSGDSVSVSVTVG